MSRTAIWLLLVLVCGALAAACDPCPSCPVHVETPTPTPTATPTFTATATATPTFTPTATATPTFTATPTASPTPTPTATGTATPTATPTGFGPGSFKGTYSLRFAGKTRSGNPEAGVGILTSDGVSKVTGSLTQNKDGVVCQFTLGGSYTVNPDGTGTITVTETPSGGGCAASGGSVVSVLFNMGKGAVIVGVTGGVDLGSLLKQ